MTSTARARVRRLCGALLVFFSFCCTVGAARVASAAGAPPEDPFARAVAALERGELAAALEAARAVPASAEAYPQAQYLAGETLLVLGDVRGASRAFLEVLERRPEAVPALVGLGRALVAQGGHEDAEIHLAAALELAPKDVAALRATGELCLATGRPERAREVLEKARALDPKGPLTVAALVRLELAAGGVKKAEELATRLARQQREHPMGPFLLGLVRERQGEVDEAIEAYSQALERDPRFLDAHKNLAIVGHTMSDTYRIAERNELALRHYERYFALGGRDPELERTYRQLEAFLRPRTDKG